jgi:hypothetical protein
VLKDWLPACGAISGNFMECGLADGVRSLRGVPLTGILGLWPLPLSLFVSGHHEVSSFFCHAPHHDVLPCHNPKSNMAYQP